MLEIIFKDKHGTPVSHFTQWDSNQSLYIHNWNYDSVPVIHFFNRNMNKALVVNSELFSENIVKVNVPNILLETPCPINVCIYLLDNDSSSKTVHIEEISVRPRAKPEDYEFVENIEYVSWAELETEARALIDELNSIETPQITTVTAKTLDPDDEATAYISGETSNLALTIGIPKGDPGMAPPLVLSADESDSYLTDPSYGDEALDAIIRNRQILVRTPNADGGKFTAIYSPILTYQLPNYANNYLYLFYLRDEKQNLSSTLGVDINVPVYGELKMLLSETYNESPLVRPQDHISDTLVYLKGERGSSGAPRNWLDNSYFMNPINQNGLTEVSYNTCIDRWEAASADYTMEVVDDGIKITGDCRSIIPDYRELMGKTVTIALHGYYPKDMTSNVPFTIVASGTLPTVFNDATVCVARLDYGVTIDLRSHAMRSALVFDVTGTSFEFPATLQWAALYEGEYTTDTLPEYQYKGYAVELIECQRYFKKYSKNTCLTTGYIDGNGQVRFSLPLSAPFRNTPTVSETTFGWIVDGNSGTFTATPQIYNTSNNEICLTFDTNDVIFEGHINKQITLFLEDSEFTLSAEL